MPDVNLEDFTASEDITKVLREASRYKTEALTAKSQVKALTKEIEILDSQVNLLADLKSRSVKPPSWLRPKKQGKETGIVCAVLSDTHFDEVVNPDEIQGRNAYNRDIAVTNTHLTLTTICSV